MAQSWVLHTETKGTGAQVVALESVQQRPSSVDPVLVRRVPAAPAPEPEPEPAPRAPHRFRVVDVMTRQVLADDVGIREAVQALAGVRSVMDVNVYVWRPSREQWQPLPMADKRTLFQRAHAV